MKRILHAGATMGIGLHAGVLVVVHGGAAPSREDWDAVCRAVSELHGIARGQLVVSHGGMPNAAQRKAAIGSLPEGFVAPPAAVISGDAMIRGVITAMNWFLNDSHRAFRPGDVAGVAAHLGRTDEEARELVAFAEELAPR